MKYVYPAVFRPEDGAYCVFFPDIKQGATQGDDIADAMYMAQDFLTMALYDMETSKSELPEPSKLEDIEKNQGDIVTLVYADTMDYRRKFDSKAVNKTLTIPNWLNSLAEDAEVNFSQTLQKALKKKLKLNK